MTTYALPETVTGAAMESGVRLETDLLTVDRLVVDDPFVVAHFGGVEPERRVDELHTALAIGVRGIEAMGSGATAHRIGELVDRVVQDALTKTQSTVEQLLVDGRRELGRALDPEVRSSMTSRMVTELGMLHRELLDGIDPDRRDSRTARFVSELEALLGPEGRLADVLDRALDPNADESGVAVMMRSMEAQFQGLRDLIVGSAARSAEADRGTAKGFDYEDLVEARLRSEARHLGAVVERTSSTAGTAGPGTLVGDFVVVLPSGDRVAVEAKHASRITLNGKDGILGELDRAMVNRNATWAVCVSHDDAFPDEVGSFGIYANRVLVVDDGTGEMLRVALRWIAAASTSAGRTLDRIDIDRVEGQLQRLRNLANRFSRTKRGLTAVQSSVEAVRCEIDELRTELLDGVGEVADELLRSDRTG